MTTAKKREYSPVAIVAAEKFRDALKALKATNPHDAVFLERARHARRLCAMLSHMGIDGFALRNNKEWVATPVSAASLGAALG